VRQAHGTQGRQSREEVAGMRTLLEIAVVVTIAIVVALIVFLFF
jgi:hypothetical protein